MQNSIYMPSSFLQRKYSQLINKIITTVFFFFQLIFLTNTVISQEIIVHYQLFEWEDGIPNVDADGIKNGIVVWKSGTVHVIDGSYDVGPAYGETSATLIVEPGAIIKVAGKIEVDANGKIISWSPGGSIESGPLSTLKLNRVIITDIRDDSVGGDTNGDGNASSPDDLPNYWGTLAMSGNDKDILQNCTIKYCYRFGGFGSIKIENNHFINIIHVAPGTGFPGYSGELVYNAAPVITGNTFEFRGPWYGIDLRGMSPIFENNTIRGAYFGVQVGPSFMDGKAGPISGSTIIADNTFENCVSSIEATAHAWGSNPDEVFNNTPPFNVSIRNNKITGSGNGATGITIDFSSKGEILYNKITNCGMPVKIYNDSRYLKYGGDAFNGLRINYNNFSLENAYGGPDSISYRYWSKGMLINAKFNYWGDPSGPFDNSNKDGLYNPAGKGLKIGNGIDYKYFIGGAEDPMPDAIRISASSNPLEPLTPKSSVTFNVNVDQYQLKSSPNGKITILLKDECGMILNSSGTTIDVNSSGTSASIPAIQVTVPEFSSQISVEASLSPEGDKAVTVYSNHIVFLVNKPQSSFQLTGIKDVSSGKSPDLIQDTKTTLRFEFSYNLAGTGNGTLEIDLKERASGSGNVLQDFPLSTITITPGNNQKASKDIEVNLPIRDQDQVPKDEIYYLITMKDDQGKVSGKVNGVLPVRKSKNWANFFAAIPGKVVDATSITAAEREYFLVGEVPVVITKCVYQIEKPNVTNWQMQLGPLDVVDRVGNVIYSYPPTTIHWNNLQTTGGTTMETNTAAFRMQDGSPVIASGAANVIVYVKLIDPDRGITVSTNKTTIEVREVSQTVEKDIAQGPGEVSFDQIPVKLNFTSNSYPGKATAHEFSSSYSSSLSKSSLCNNSLEGLFSKFIPLNRFWSVYDTLKEGTFTSTISITYDPSKDFPFAPEFNEDSLVIVSLNPNNNQLEALASTLDKSNHTITTDYLKFFDTYIVASKTSSLTGISRSDRMPDEFSLLQNYPNPFNPATVISYRLAVFGHVELKVFDILGREIAVLVNEVQAAGEYKVKFNSKTLPSGVYIYSIKTGEYKNSKKLVILK